MIRAWAAAVEASGVSSVLPALCELWGGKIVALYAEEHRRYHTADHVLDLLSLLEARIDPGVHDADALAMTAFFHDAIYEVGAGAARAAPWAAMHEASPPSPAPGRSPGQNEYESADLWRAFAREGRGRLAAGGMEMPPVISEGSEARVARWIEATAAHLTCETGGDPSLELFLDCDLAVLGRPRDEYSAYAAAIRVEYASVGDAAYRAGRAKVLRGFLSHDRLYRTPACAAEWEARARANIEWEVAQLEAQEV